MHRWQSGSYRNHIQSWHSSVSTARCGVIHQQIHIQCWHIIRFLQRWQSGSYRHHIQSWHSCHHGKMRCYSSADPHTELAHHSFHARVGSYRIQLAFFLGTREFGFICQQIHGRPGTSFVSCSDGSQVQQKSHTELAFFCQHGKMRCYLLADPHIELVHQSRHPKTAFRFNMKAHIQVAYLSRSTETVVCFIDHQSQMDQDSAATIYLSYAIRVFEPVHITISSTDYRSE